MIERARSVSPWLMLLALGTLGGSIADSNPERRVERRAGYRVLSVDLHTHTRFSDGFAHPFDVVLAARRAGLDAFALTEHNVVFPGELARWFSNVIGGPTVVVGEEITTARHHLIALGLSERVPSSPRLRDTIAAVHRQNGVAIAAHPVRQFWRTFEAVVTELDGAEVMHPIAYRGGSSPGGWRWPEMVEFYERETARGHVLTAVGSSDYHFGRMLGLCRTLVFARDASERAIIDALRAHRTVVYDGRGRAYGDPALAAVLAREPIARPPVPGYEANGRLDAAARVLGWIGLVLWIVVRNPLRSRTPRG